MKLDDAFSKGRLEIKEENVWPSLVESGLGCIRHIHRDNIWASSAALCERQTAGMLQIKINESVHRSGSSEFYFEIGSSIERVMEDAFRNSGVYVDSEVRVESYHPELDVSGRIDFVLKDPKNEELVLVELKTCGKLPDRPKPAHKAQLLAYLALTGMERGLLWYISRSVASWDGKILQKVFEIVPTKPERLQTIMTMVKGQLYVNKNAFPPKPDRMKKTWCGFCFFVPHCWKGEDVNLNSLPLPNDQIPDLIKNAQRITEEFLSNSETLRKQFISLYE